MANSDYTIKIVLLGEAGVGKTSLVYQFMEKKFRDNYKQTLGVNLLKKDMHIDGYGGVSAQIWDLGGQVSPLINSRNGLKVLKTQEENNL
jgi:small GTP-binding protein